MITKSTILIYDDLCYSCSKFAKFAYLLCNGQIRLVGHYSVEGKKIKQAIFPKNYDGYEMFWFIIDGYAYGGRAGLGRLIRYVFFHPKGNRYPESNIDLTKCTDECKMTKAVFLRSKSIFSHYKKLKISD